MSNDDLPVILYKLLAYLYECMKRELPPSESQARDICGANATMLAAAAQSAVDKGLATGITVKRYYDGERAVRFEDAMLTADGAEYLIENSTMKKAREVAGSVFQAALDVAMATLGRIAAGL